MSPTTEKYHMSDQPVKGLLMISNHALQHSTITGSLVIVYLYNAHPLLPNTTHIQNTNYITYYHYISPLNVCVHFQLGSEINLEGG